MNNIEKINKTKQLRAINKLMEENDVEITVDGGELAFRVNGEMFYYGDALDMQDLNNILWNLSSEVDHMYDDVVDTNN